ncbi:hypothetical protein NL529_28290, partial [Klebsiella pneumoniae]|nr:hypothetical protein [Klebsiella pneumoniae]
MRAQPKHLVDLRYDVDPLVQGCPDVAAFRALLADRLGYDPCCDESAMTVDVRVQRAERGILGSV